MARHHGSGDRPKTSIYTTNGQNLDTNPALTWFGRALLRDEQVDRAEQVLHLATTRFPVDATAFFFYAQAAERLKHLDAARQALIDFAALRGDDGQAAERAERIASLSMQLSDPAAAAKWLRKAVDEGGPDGGGVRRLSSLADAQLKAGDSEAATATVSRGLAIDPGNRDLLTLARRLKMPGGLAASDR